MKNRNFKFDPKQAESVQRSLENLENETLKGLSGDLLKGGEWRLSIFGKKAQN